MYVRALGPGDEALLDPFLAAHAPRAMFLRSNLRRAGIRDTGAPFSGAYIGAFERSDGDRLVAAGAHFWNGVIVTVAGGDAAAQAARAAAVASAAARATGRPVAGVIGPWVEVVAARDALGLADAATALESREDLFDLDLDALREPAPLVDGAWVCRPPRIEEIPALAEWRAAYHVEALGATPGPELAAAARREIETLHAEAAHWVLDDGDRTVAYSAFNARLPDLVQVGGVYTPPELRGRGYGRAVVAGSLRAARAEGVRRAILFTGDDNAPARAAYLALGFVVIGDYGLVLFRGAPHER